MSKKFLTIALITLLLLVFWLMAKNGGANNNQFFNPFLRKSVNSIVSSEVTVPSPTPETFKFDRSTDLKKELDSVNPQIRDSDFK